MAASQASPIELGLARLAPWILWPFVPAAAVLGACGALLIALGIVWLTSFASGPLSLALRPIAVGVVMYAFIRCGVLCAPNSQRAVALMLATFPLVLCAMFVLPASVMPPSHSSPASTMPIESLEVDTPFVVPDRFAWLYFAGLVLFIPIGVVAAIAKSWRDDNEPAWPLPRRWSVALRWVLLGPATLLLAFLTYAWFGEPNADPTYVLFLVVFIAAVFVLSATLIAPAKQRIVGICSLVLVSLVAIVAAAFARAHWQQFLIFKWTAALLAVAGGVLGLLAALTVSTTSSETKVAKAAGLFERLSWGKLWTAVVAGISVVVTGTLIVHGVFFKPVDQSVFSPPQGWHRFPQIPGITPAAQLGHWVDGSGTIWVQSWQNSVKRNATLTTHSFDQSHDSNVRLDSARIISICGGHQALVQSSRQSWLGEDDAMIDVWTIWGTTVFWARYARPALTEADAGAVRSLRTLCGGAAAQRPVSNRPSTTGKRR